MFMASRETKCARFLDSCAGHSAPVQRTAAPSGSRSTGAPQTGHMDGRRNGTASCGRFSGTTARISGMISPALRMVTVSPMRISFSEMKS